MGFEAICDETVPNDLKSMQKVASTRNLQSNNKGILINVNQKFLKNMPGIYLTN